MGTVNEDLQRERDKCTFDITELTTLFDGGKDKMLERKEREELMVSKREFEQGVCEDLLSHKGKYEECMRKSIITFGHIRQMQREGKIKITDYKDVLDCLLGSGNTRDGSPLALHYMMFMPAILSLATTEQQEYWLSKAWDCKIIGSYAQTELGHGTFIRGLETIATYDATTKEFVLHSPTITSYKWWPGGIGHTANYSIVVAQLYTKGECHGIHWFMVQVRDEETHETVPGIKLGDIGPKMGLQPVNNGFLGFEHVRIPRSHMLMKHAQVLEDGTYVKSSNQKLLYAAMVFVRVLILSDMVNHLSKAVTIATRYSAVRRQTPVIKGGPELQILDYATHQHKLFINIASTYAIRIVANKQWEIYYKVNDEVANGNCTRLAELHALACCLKAVGTSDAASGVERMRRACGGQGYLQSSYLPQLGAFTAAACTYEGDNTVLLLQTARFLVKTWQQIDSSSLTPTVAYMRPASAARYLDRWENSVEGIIHGLQVVAVKKIAGCVTVMEKRVQSGMALEDAWNMTSVQLEAAAEAHCRVILVTFFFEGISEWLAKASPPLRHVLQLLLELYAVYWALEKMVDLMKYTCISGDDAEALQSRYEQLLSSLRPHAVPLVDALGIRDELLQSTLGAYDGQVYERLMQEALKSPLNEDRVNQTFHKYLKPFMKGKL
ncbi:hypothetical protein evm_004694 [Chilo suppressalis]|nr:hypothetical protein evm_004694 [Chilo suppressalis]